LNRDQNKKKQRKKDKIHYGKTRTGTTPSGRFEKIRNIQDMEEALRTTQNRVRQHSTLPSLLTLSLSPTPTTGKFKITL
jgi:hypothetical protein